MRTRTKRQKEILDYITDFIDSRGYEPSYQQIAKHFQINSKSAIAKHVAALEQQGLLTRRRENGSFNLLVRSKVELSNNSVCEIEWLDVPRNGDFFEEWENEPLLVPKFMLGYLTTNRVRAFLVPDDAMLDKQIREGDIALIEEKSFARDGEAVVAVIERKRSVLKSFFRDGAFIELRPANEDFEILRLAANKVEIKGVYRGLLRPLI